MANKLVYIEDVLYFEDRNNDKQKLNACILTKVITYFFGILSLRSIKNLCSIFYSPFNAQPTASLPFSNLSLPPSLLSISFGPSSSLLSHVTISPGNILIFFINYFANLVLEPPNNISNLIFVV